MALVDGESMWFVEFIACVVVLNGSQLGFPSYLAKDYVVS